MDQEIQIDSVYVSDSSLQSSKWAGDNHDKLSEQFKGKSVLVLDQEVFGVFSRRNDAEEYWQDHPRSMDMILIYF